jgi:hypothetical protein
LIEGDQAGAQTVVEVVVVVGNFVGQIADLRFEGRLRAIEKALAEFAKRRAFSSEQCLTMPSRVSKQRLRPVKGRVTLLEQVDRAQTLQVVLEAAVVAHAFVERFLAGMAKRRMAEVVCQRDRFHEVFVELQGARDAAGDLRHFEAVRQAGTEQIALVIDEDLRLVFEAPESGRVYDAVPVALEVAAVGRLAVRMKATARVGRLTA